MKSYCSLELSDSSKSLPSRECGLKCGSVAFSTLASTSLPSRECGLKLLLPYGKVSFRVSLPSRECGLKCTCRLVTLLACRVTPFAGVWIEICNYTVKLQVRSVTPFAGVWIEISICSSFITTNYVTPFAGVWIEILFLVELFSLSTSLPSRECGLKYQNNACMRLLGCHSLRGSVD